MGRKKKIPEDILNSYKSVDTCCWINDDDPDLKPIKINLPEAPNPEVIAGYGLHAEDQVFTREEYPKKLKTLEIRIKKEVKEELDGKAAKHIERVYEERMWEYLSDHKEDYADEIFWIRKQWYHRINGYWFYCNGKPTYLCGWNWSYLNYCKLQGVVERDGLPEYRDRDRKWFHAQNHFYYDTATIAYDIVKKKGEKVKVPIVNEDGSFETIDLGTRTVYGTNNLKARRVGETSKTAWINVDLSTRHKEFMGGIQGDADATGKTVFIKHVVYAYRRLPWFFKPYSSSGLSPKSEIVFEGDDLDISLGSKIDYATTVHRNFYDSNRLDFYHCDEGGKVYREDIRKRHLVVKTCLVRGSVIKGFTIYTSTVGEMDGSTAGDKFLELTLDSNYEQRNSNGQTKSGLVNVFFSAAEGLDGFIGKYGESIVNDPTEAQLPYLKTKVKINGRFIGAKEYIENRRKPYLESEDYELLSNEKREYPLIFRECFTPPASAMLWNINKLEKRFHELKFQVENPVRQGNFRWIEGFGGPVEFVDSDIGRFFMSYEPPVALRNARYQKGRLWFPGNADIFIASADPYQHEKTQDGRRSNGGGAIRWMRDFSVDPEDTDDFHLKSRAPVCTYDFRPSSRTLYAEDMLMMSIYYGALMYPETNVPLIVDKFTEWGFKGYFLYDVDPLKRKKKDKPGHHVTDKAEAFGLMADDIDANCHRWNHEDLIKQCLAIKRMEDLGKFDLLAAYMGTLLGEKSKYTQRVAKGSGLKVNLGALNIPKLK
jgi:hypothetical protein